MAKSRERSSKFDCSTTKVVVPTPKKCGLGNISSGAYRIHIGVFPHPLGCGVIELWKSILGESHVSANYVIFHVLLATRSGQLYEGSRTLLATTFMWRTRLLGSAEPREHLDAASDSGIRANLNKCDSDALTASDRRVLIPQWVGG